MISLGIDTSNYTTSVAAAEDGVFLCQKRKLLDVKKGEKGLRQSDALFQHWNNLPKLLSELFEEIPASEVDCICVSTRPRSQEGSYMPVFYAGYNMAVALSSALGIPVCELSHQDGHIIAAAYENNIDFSRAVVCAHLSGGTLELVLLKDGNLSVIGGTRDISYGQLIDRTGVDLGFPFPSGKYIDSAATEKAAEYIRSRMSKDSEGMDRAFKNPYCRIHTEGCFVNLSGIETQIKKDIVTSFAGVEASGTENASIPYFLMERICESFLKIGNRALEESGAEILLVSGGVACSNFLRDYCRKNSSNYIFGKPELCNDNAAGIALSGGKLPWL